MCNQIVKWGVAYFFKPVSMEVWPLQMPWVATLTTPFLNANSSGRTSAAKLTGSWRKTTESQLNACSSDMKMKTYVYVSHRPEERSFQHTWDAIGLDVPV